MLSDSLVIMQEYIHMLYHIKEITENSILLDSVTTEVNNKNKAHNSAFMHKMYSLCKVNNTVYIAKLSVEEFPDGKYNTLKRLYNVQDIKIEPLRHAAFTDKQLALSVLNDSDISIADLFRIVKESDNDFYLNKREFKLEQTELQFDTEIEHTEKTEKKQESSSDVQLSLFHEIGGYTPDDIENTVKDWVSEKLSDNGIDAEIRNVIVAGSRSRGLEYDNSDIDVVVELRSDLKEDALFNILHEDYIDIDGVPIDINPIRPEESGSLEAYLPAAEQYLEQKRVFQAEKMPVSAEQKSSEPTEIRLEKTESLETSEKEPANIPSSEKTSIYTEIDSETAAGIFVDGGFEVYNKDSVLVPDHAYIIENSEQPFKAAAEDVEVFAMREEIALKIDDISSAYERTPMEFGEPYHLDLMRSASSNFGWNSFNDGKNVYENVMAVLRENNLDVLREYLNEVCNIENGTRLENMANEAMGLLDSYADKYINNELTEKEKSFLDMNAVEFITKGVLSWDEVESLSYIFFEEGYTERHKPSEKSLYGRGLRETEAFSLAERYRNGEDISRELVKALIGSDGERRTDLLNGDNEYSLEKYIMKYTDNTITVSYGNASLEAIYAEIAQFFLDRMENEYRDIEIARAEEAEITVKAESQNFTITDDTFGEGGSKSKFKDNIAAIETLKIIEAENRPATPEEQEILSRYVGWGGLQAAFDSENKAWSSEYALLKETLTDKEYSAARASTLDSFYTSSAIIDGIYEALDSFGFTGGNVLDKVVTRLIQRIPQNPLKSRLFAN